MPLLSVRNVTKRYGGLVANDSVSFDVDEGALFAIIGPNRAGKTNLFNVISRAVPADSRLLLLDEPAAGLNTGETEALAHMIQRVNGRGITVVLIEHDMGLVMRIAQRIAVIDFGRKIAEGTADEVRAHPDVIAAYL